MKKVFIAILLFTSACNLIPATLTPESAVEEPTEEIKVATLKEIGNQLVEPCHFEKKPVYTVIRPGGSTIFYDWRVESQGELISLSVRNIKGEWIPQANNGLGPFRLRPSDGRVRIGQVNLLCVSRLTDGSVELELWNTIMVIPTLGPTPRPTLTPRR